MLFYKVYIITCAFIFIHLIQPFPCIRKAACRAFCQAFSAVDAQVLLTFFIGFDGGVSQDGYETDSGSEFLCDQVVAVPKGPFRLLVVLLSPFRFLWTENKKDTAP